MKRLVVLYAVWAGPCNVLAQPFDTFPEIPSYTPDPGYSTSTSIETMGDITTSTSSISTDAPSWVPADTITGYSSTIYSQPGIGADGPVPGSQVGSGNSTSYGVGLGWSFE